MRRVKTLLPRLLLITIVVPLLLSPSVLAANGSVTQIETFIRSIINISVGLAGLVATGFFVVGGFGYITSSGNPERLDRSKHTLIYAATGLTIVIAAYVISNIVTTLATNAFGA